MRTVALLNRTKLIVLGAPLEPRQIICGDTTSWTRTQRDYPADAGWVLSYYLSKGAEEPTVIQAVADGADFKVSTVLTLEPGAYRWIARMEKGQDRRTVAAGRVQVLPDPTVAYDRRTKAEKCLAAVEAVLENRVGDPIVEFEIYEGVKAKNISHAELLTLRDRFRTEVRMQRGGAAFRTIPIGRGR